MKKYKTILIDDEIDNINILSHFISKYCPNLEVTSTYLTFNEAVSNLPNDSVDIIFMDIKLDYGTGFDVLDEVNIGNSQIIFVTAFDEFAIRAFKYNVVDYLLKPIDIEELIKASNLAIERINKFEFFDQKKIDILRERLSSIDKSYNDFVAISTIDNVEFIKVGQILYIKSDGKYSEFHLQNGKIVVSSKNLGEYEKSLDESIFFRIHNSYMINLSFVERIDKSKGNYIELIGGIFLPIARRKLDKLHRFINIK